jgi:single-stranded DNA-specific DHH superfamily exonuclease
MLTKKQVEEIREHLEKAQNPVFFFDNDQDGLCSFLLLQKFIGRGKGVSIKTFPSLDETYMRKIEEFNSDYVFILDKPVVSKEFFKRVEQINIPVVWIDHHDVDKNDVPEFVNFYNPLFNKVKTNEPVTALCYQITNKKEDLWIAIAGCVSDRFVPDFYSEFEKLYPDLSISSNDAFGILYTSQIGKIARILGFGLKDKITNVVSMLKFLINSKNPYEVLEESKKNKFMHDRFNYLNSRYQKFLKKAIESSEDYENLLFFKYAGDLSVSSDLSNELSYRFPNKTIAIVYITGINANISLRGKNIREGVLEVIAKLKNARGGGHENAVGVRINLEDLESFKESLLKLF